MHRGGRGGCLNSLGERYSETIVLYLVLFIAASLAVPSPVQQKSTVAAPAYNLAIGRYCWLCYWWILTIQQKLAVQKSLRVVPAEAAQSVCACADKAISAGCSWGEGTVGTAAAALVPE